MHATALFFLGVWILTGIGLGLFATIMAVWRQEFCPVPGIKIVTDLGFFSGRGRSLSRDWILARLGKIFRLGRGGHFGRFRLMDGLGGSRRIPRAYHGSPGDETYRPHTGSAGHSFSPVGPSALAAKKTPVQSVTHRCGYLIM